MWSHMGYGATAWWMWALIALGAVGFWLVVAYVVRAVVHGRPTPSAVERPAPDPLQLLDERLARGEIDAEEYQRTRNLLTRES
ncbi:SHOCT domain-containing protein [Intrasporangium sp.]|uniref:SHOCT domain-containing protein n=1 Tax=Intrasporangium sp. TaxID=1925024 RepID=UPI0032221C9B